jgi:hypothetical protein
MLDPAYWVTVWNKLIDPGFWGAAWSKLIDPDFWLAAWKAYSTPEVVIPLIPLLLIALYLGAKIKGAIEAGKIKGIERNDLVAGFGVVTQALVKLSSANDELQRTFIKAGPSSVATPALATEQQGDRASKGKSPG